MKKLFYLFMGLGLVLTTSCDPLDDIYTTIDEQETPIVGEATYVLSDDDYDELGLVYGSFSSLDDPDDDKRAKLLLPPFFAEMFPYWGKNSSVLAGFKLYVGNAPGVSDYTYADDYQLTESDYALSGSDAEGFYPDADPEEYIADILKAGVSSPAEDDIILAVDLHLYHQIQFLRRHQGILY